MAGNPGNPSTPLVEHLEHIAKTVAQSYRIADPAISRGIGYAPHVWSDDVVSEILLHLLVNLEGLQRYEDPDNAAWAAARRRAIDLYRRSERRKRVMPAHDIPLVDADGNPVESTSETERLDIASGEALTRDFWSNERASVIVDVVDSAVERLPSREKMIVQLHYWGNLPLEDVAKSMSLGETRIRELLTWAKHRLRVALKTELGNIARLSC